MILRGARLGAGTGRSPNFVARVLLILPLRAKGLGLRSCYWYANCMYFGCNIAKVVCACLQSDYGCAVFCPVAT